MCSNTAGCDGMAVTGRVAGRGFFNRSAVVVAPDLLGCVIEHVTDDGLVAVRLTEVEAYSGDLDPASHAYRGPTPRNAVMFGAPGHLYVYFTYGMHFCANVVCGGVGIASAVLLRAGEVVDGTALASGRRGRATPRDLARGPARLTVALGLGRDDNGLDLCDPGSGLRLRRMRPTARPVLTGPRVGVSAGEQTPWRFWLDGEPTVSPYRAHVPKRRAVKPSDQ